MSLVLLVPLAALAGLAATVVTARRPRATATTDDVATSPAAYGRARRHAAAVAWASWAALLAAGMLLPDAVAPGVDAAVLTACVPAAAGLLALLVAAVGERTWPRPATPVRRAALVRRTAADVAPRRLTGLTLGWAGTLLAVLTATALSADAGGRTVTVALDATASSTAGPYPGAPYAVPLLLATLVLLGATAATVHLVAARPAVTEVSTDDDARLRRASARRVLAVTQLVLGGTLGGVLLVTGGALQRRATAGWSVDDVATTATDPLVLALGSGALVTGIVVVLVTTVVAAVALAQAARTARPPVTETPDLLASR